MDKGSAHAELTYTGLLASPRGLLVPPKVFSYAGRQWPRWNLSPHASPRSDGRSAAGSRLMARRWACFLSAQRPAHRHAPADPSALHGDWSCWFTALSPVTRAKKLFRSVAAGSTRPVARDYASLTCRPNSGAGSRYAKAC